MQDLGAGSLWAVFYDVIVLIQPCYDFFEKMAHMNIKKHIKLLELICMQIISQSILFIWMSVGIANVSPNYVHVYDEYAAVVDIRQCTATIRN